MKSFGMLCFNKKDKIYFKTSFKSNTFATPKNAGLRVEK